MASLSLRRLVKRYGHGRQQQQVLHGIDAEIAEGEFIVIVGPSGCGKSTLLRLIAGLETVTEGEIVFTTAAGSRVVNDVEPADRDIAMVFQNYALYPHMSVFDNIAYGLKIAGLPRQEIRDRVDKVAVMLELGALLERRPRALSGGQRQRVAMGRAIVRQPQVFLFDEPLSNLDARLRVQTRLEIQRLHAELGTTSLFVTHDQSEAMTLAQRMIVMHDGRIEQIGTPEAVYRTPASTFVASFIGSPPMNLLRGHTRARAEGALQFLPDGADPSTALALSGEGASVNGTVVLGVRAEHLRLADVGHPAAWPFRVEVVEMLGAERLLHGRLGASAAAPLVTCRIDADRPAPVAGMAIGLRPDAGALHWFDADSGRRLSSDPATST
jgi:sn-glycerol 3-phosphate transport system ATP-binding protein